MTDTPIEPRHYIAPEFSWYAPIGREGGRYWFSRPENLDRPADTETDEYIAWEQLADLFTAR